MTTDFQHSTLQWRHLAVIKVCSLLLKYQTYTGILLNTLPTAALETSKLIESKGSAKRSIDSATQYPARNGSCDSKILTL